MGRNFILDYATPLLVVVVVVLVLILFLAAGEAQESQAGTKAVENLLVA